jgi:hypothetical protein
VKRATRATEILETVMFRNISQEIYPGMAVNMRRFWRPMRPFSLIVCLLVLVVFEHRTDVANAASFRVDDATLTVPALLGDDWRAVTHRKTWTRATGDAIPGDPRFVRFRAREYSFQLSGAGLRLKTTWFAARKCVSTDEAVSRLRGSKRAAIETAFGSLDDMNRRLQKKTSDGTEGRIVIWAQFRSKPDESLPIDALAAEDQEILSPFAELAKQSFEARIFNSSNCSENEDPKEARNAARSGGRRMSSSRSGSKSRSKPARGRPLPGGVIPGAILQEAGSSYTGDGQRIVRDRDASTDKQRFGFLLSKYVAEPGSLTFNVVGRFTRCVRARNQAEALAAMRAKYPRIVAAVRGRRTSYTVVVSPAAVCQDAEHNRTAGEYVPGNFNKSGEKDTLTPSPDPLNGDSSSDGGGGSEGLDDLDLKSIPS